MSVERQTLAQHEKYLVSHADSHNPVLILARKVTGSASKKSPQVPLWGLRNTQVSLLYPGLATGVCCSQNGPS